MTAQSIGDLPECWPVRRTLPRYSGSIFSVRTDWVAMPDGDVADRDVVRHPGAVAVLAIDDSEQVLMVRQYRHPGFGLAHPGRLLHLARDEQRAGPDLPRARPERSAGRAAALHAAARGGEHAGRVGAARSGRRDHLRRS